MQRPKLPTRGLCASCIVTLIAVLFVGCGSNQVAGPVLTQCPPVDVVQSFLPEITHPDSTASDAHNSPAPTLSCGYRGSRIQTVVNVYTDSDLASLERSYRSLVQAAQSETGTDRYDRYVETKDLLATIDINDVEDVSSTGVRLLGGVAVAARRDDTLCASPLFGTNFSAQTPEEAKAKSDGTIDLVRHFCGIATTDTAERAGSAGSDGSIIHTPLTMNERLLRPSEVPHPLGLDVGAASDWSRATDSIFPAAPIEVRNGVTQAYVDKSMNVFLLQMKNGSAAANVASWLKEQSSSTEAISVPGATEAVQMTSNDGANIVFMFRGGPFVYLLTTGLGSASDEQRSTYLPLARTLIETWARRVVLSPIPDA